MTNETVAEQPGTPLLPPGITACLFDLDGVLTKTAAVHAAAWRQMFDDYLRARAARTGEPFVPFDPVDDYDNYVDGRPRRDGTKTFLHSRGIDLPDGAPGDPPDAETVYALSERKNWLVSYRIAHDGVAVFPDAVTLLRAARTSGMPTAVVTASANRASVLAAAGLSGMFTAIVDGVVAEREQLAGKPAPDTYLAAARKLAVPPGSAAVFEDALAGVEAGRAGGFGYVVGVDRVGQADALRSHGADIVVTDLTKLVTR